MRGKNVFVNRLLNLRKIKYLGLDMDHTLIRYNTEKFETLVYELVIEKLINYKGYPDYLRQMTFNFNAAIRGLVIDSKHGNILKLSRHGAIRKSYHGINEISFSEQSKRYNSQYIDLNDDNYLVIDTAFSIAFCALYSQLVDLKDTHSYTFPSYAEIAQDLLECHDATHRDGSLKGKVKKNLNDYIIKDKAVVDGLQRFKQHGKKVFILTNSEFDYTKSLLDFAINPYLDDGQTWVDLFDYVITLAEKPRFFYDKLKFLHVNPQDGSMTNVSGLISPGVYQGGCAEKFTQSLQVAGDEILYIGDHIYGDVVQLKKACNWRTALVVEELASELGAIIKSAPLNQKIAQLMSEKEPLEQRVTELISKEIEQKSRTHDAQIHGLQKSINKLDDAIAQLIQQHQTVFNKFWGPIFRAGAEESYFAYQVDRFACIYMEKLVNLFDYSPRHYFRATQRPLAHEVVLNMQ
jgi:HAD superfamily 5'-nucleotidase-like hydrolase